MRLRRVASWRAPAAGRDGLIPEFHSIGQPRCGLSQLACLQTAGAPVELPPCVICKSAFSNSHSTPPPLRLKCGKAKLFMPVEPTMETPSQRSTAAPQATELSVSGMTCGNCARHVTEAIQSVPGVHSASVNLDARRASVRWAAEQNDSRGHPRHRSSGLRRQAARSAATTTPASTSWPAGNSTCGSACSAPRR